MPQDYGSSRGVPLPTGCQWLFAAVVLGAGWFLWPSLQRPPTDSRGPRHGNTDEAPVAAALDNLRAVEDIARSGPDGLPYLVESLANQNFRIRRNALLALRSMGPGAVEALTRIQDRLTDEDTQVRTLAIDAYWRIRRDPEDVAAVVAPLLGDDATEVRDAATHVLQSIGPSATRAIVDLLRSGAPTAQVPALIVLRRIGWDATQAHVDEVLRDLAGDPKVRVDALWTLATWGRPSAVEIRELLHHSEASDRVPRAPQTEPGPRETALRAIIRLAPAAENLNDVVSLLVASRRDEPQWGLAVAALLTMRSAALTAAPKLLRFMDTIRDYRRIDIGWALLAIGGDPQEIASRTIPLLVDEDTDLCFHAGRLCASASPAEARRQVSRLIPLLAPEKLAGRLSALEAVWGLAPEAHEAVPALSRLIDCDQPHVAPIAAKVLGDIGSEAAVAIPILLGRLARKPPGHDKAARSAFCEAIGKMGPSAQSAIPRLLAELREAPLASSPGRELDRNDQRVVRTLLFALIRLGNTDPAVLSEIRRHLANEDEHVQLSALRALARLTPDSTDVLASHWTWFCEHPGSRNRIGVILAIGRLAGDRPDAVAILTALLPDRDPEICKAAAWSLGKIGGAASEALPTLRELVKDSPDVLNSNYDRQSLQRSLLADNPRIQFERDRWIDREDPLFSGANDGLDWSRSLAEIAREAVAAIEAGSQESPPPAFPN